MYAIYKQFKFGAEFENKKGAETLSFCGIMEYVEG